jgi:hypothetical protein
MDQDPWVAKADAHRVQFQQNVLPLYGRRWVAGSLALMIAGIVLAVVRLEGFFPIAAVAFSIVVAVFAIARGITARRPLRQFAHEPDWDFSEAPAESVRRIPAGLLEPADALDLQHLDEMTNPDVTRLPQDRLQRRLAEAVGASTGVSGLGWVVRVIAIGGAAAITFDRGVVWEYLGPLLLVVVGSLAAAAIAVPSSRVNRINRIVWADRVIKTRTVLEQRDLADDGSLLSILVRGGDRIDVDLKRIPRRSRPRPGDFADARAGRFMREPIAAWVIAGLALIGGATSALMATIAG